MSSDGPYLLAVISLGETERSRGAALAPLVTSLFDRLGITRMRLVVGRTTDREDPIAEAEAELSRSLHDRAALDHALADPAVLSIIAHAGGATIGASLRFADDDTGCGPLTLYAVLPWTALDAAIGWLRHCAERADVLHGGITLFATTRECLVEATFVGVDMHTAAPETYARWTYDTFRRADLFTHARRLYWLTVLGPSLAQRAGGSAAALAAGANAAEEIAGSLFVRATADIDDVLDPSYRTSTVGLRRWRWPHTLQNPLDADFEPATVVLATAGRLVIESPQLGRRILRASLSELAKGTEVRVAFPGAGETLVMQIANRAITFGADGRVLHDVRVGAR